MWLVKCCELVYPIVNLLKKEGSSGHAVPYKLLQLSLQRLAIFPQFISQQSVGHNSVTIICRIISLIPNIISKRTIWVSPGHLSSKILSTLNRIMIQAQRTLRLRAQVHLPAGNLRLFTAMGMDADPLHLNVVRPKNALLVGVQVWGAPQEMPPETLGLSFIFWAAKHPPAVYGRATWVKRNVAKKCSNLKTARLSKVREQAELLGDPIEHIQIVTCRNHSAGFPEPLNAQDLLKRMSLLVKDPPVHVYRRYSLPVSVGQQYILDCEVGGCGKNKFININDQEPLALVPDFLVHHAVACHLWVWCWDLPNGHDPFVLKWLQQTDCCICTIIVNYVEMINPLPYVVFNPLLAGDCFVFYES